MSTIPTNPPANPVPGAVYVDTATNFSYVYTGTGWVQASGSTGYNSQITTGAAILPGYFPAPDPSSYIAQVGSEPTNPSEGQIWVNDTVTPSPAYVWHDTGWVKLTDGTFTDTTVAAVPPTSPDTGDSYYETGTGRLYVWDGTAWKTIGENDDTNSIYSMSTPTVRPNSLPLQSGDLWVNSVSGALSYWSGSAWILINSGSSSASTYYMSVIDSEGSVNTRPDGGPFLVGDIVFESNVGPGEAYDGVVVTDSAGSSRAIGASIQSNAGAPDLIGSGRRIGGRKEGDLYINKTNNDLYRYDYGLTNWVLMSSGGGVTPATPTAEGTVYGFTDLANYNVALGYVAGNTTQTGTGNIALGIYAGGGNTTGYNNVAIGVNSLTSATTTNNNIGIGAGSLGGLTTDAPSGNNNISIGQNSLTKNVASNNVAIGFNSGQNLAAASDSNVIIGSNAGKDSSGTSNLLLGAYSGTNVTTQNSIIIGSYIGTETIPSGSLIISRHNGNNSSETLLRINESSALGFPATNGSSSVNYGTSGQILTSTGTSSPPVWTTAAGGATSATQQVEGIVYGRTNQETQSPLPAATILGYEAGLALDSGSPSNTIIGHKAANSITSASGNNTIVGSGTGTFLPSSATGITLVGQGLNGSNFPDNATAIGTNGGAILGLNQHGALSIGINSDAASWNYGNVGQYLTSQGSTLAPAWTTPTTRSFFTTANVILSSVRFFANQDQWYLLAVSDQTIPVQDPGSDASLDGTTINIVAMQTTTPIVFSNNTGSFNFSGGTTSYSWTPSRVGEVLSLSYFKDFYDYGFGIVVAISN